MNMKLSEIINNHGYGADPGEPDTGWLPGGDVRTLGFESGKPEPWFDQGEYEQTRFPIADYIFGSKQEDKANLTTVKKSVQQGSLTATLKDLDIEIEELKSTTEEMLKDIKG